MIIFAVLVFFNFFPSLTPDAKMLESEQDFRTNMLEKGDVDHLQLVTNKNLVRVISGRTASTNHTTAKNSVKPGYLPKTRTRNSSSG